MKKVFLTLILFLITSLQFSINAQPDSLKNKIEKTPTSVIVMPFFSDERYPYSSDDVRQFLIWGFYQRHFNLIMDDSSWSKVMDLNYSLSNLSIDMADSVAIAANADLIVFGTVNLSAKYRPGGIYSEQYIPNPILVKVYDKKQKSIVLFERMDLVERWGLRINYLSLEDFGYKIATRLSDLGY